MEPASLTIGAVGFAFQAFEAIQAACDIFTSAARMEEEMASLRLRLLFEYSRIVDWAQAVGLADRQNHVHYEGRVKHNKAILYAVLCELKAEVQILTKIRVRYVQDTDGSNTKHGTGSNPTAATSKNMHVTHQGKLPKTRSEMLEVSAVNEAELKPFAELLTNVEGEGVLRPQKHGKGVDKMINFFKSTKAVVTQPKRLWWASHDKESFEEHLKRVQELTEYLHESVEAGTLQKLVEDTHSTCLAVVQLERGNQAVLDALAHTQNQLAVMQKSVNLRATTSDTASSGSRQGRLLPSVDYEQLFRFKMVRQDVLRRRAPDQSSESELAMTDLDVSPTHEGQERSQGLFQNKTVFVEWKAYQVEEDSASEAEEHAIKGPKSGTVRRIRQLVAMLKSNVKPEQFRTPACFGYVQDVASQSFGIVYERPHQEGMETIRQMFDKEVPSLTDRVKAALEISSSLSYLHAVGWLHKNLCSSNIVILRAGEGQTRRALDGLRLSGFSFARPDRVEETSTSPAQDSESSLYRHPLARVGTQFRKTFDIYSLGLLLIEVAYWQPITAVVLGTKGESVGGSQAMPSETEQTDCNEATDQEEQNSPNLRDLILDSPQVLEGVARRMGDRYREAVESCIVGPDAFEIAEDEDEADAIVGTVLQLAFRRRVVDVLAAIGV